MLAKGGFEVGIELTEGSAEAEDDRSGLAHESAPVAVDVDVHLVFGVGVLENTADRIAVAGFGEVFLEGLGLHSSPELELTRSGLEADAGHGGLATAGATEPAVGVGAAAFADRGHLGGRGLEIADLGLGDDRLGGFLALGYREGRSN